MNKVLGRSVITPFFLFVFSFLVYLHNISIGVYGGDAGDFLSAIAVKGIPHPSGYPLFTMLGILFNSLPFSGDIAFKVGLVCALLSSFSVVIIYFIINELTKNKITSIISSLILAFFYPFWLYAEVTEVFALNNFFILLLIYIALLYYKRKKIRYLYFLSFFTGLSLTNNQVVILIFPSLFLLAILTGWKTLFKLKTVLICIILLVAGLLPYVYLPIAAYFNPPVNWLTAYNLKYIIRLILRLDYNSLTDSSLNYYFRYLPLKAYFEYLFLQLSPPVFITSILGMIYMVNKKKTAFFTFLFIIFFFTGPFFVAYFATPLTTRFSVGVVERFYMISAIMLIIFFSFGLDFIVNSIIRILKYAAPNLFKNPSYKYFFTLVFLMIPFYLFIYNFPKTDLHNMLWGDQMAQDILSPLPKNSVLFISGDTTLFNLLYIQYARGYRKDVTVMNMGRLDYDKTFVKEKSEIKHKNPKITEDVLNVSVVTSLAEKKPVFSLFSIKHKDEKNGKLDWMPYGLVLKLTDDKDKQIKKEVFLQKQQEMWKKFHVPEDEINKKSSAYGLSLASIPALYSVASTNMGNYLISKYYDPERAKAYYENAIKYAPTETGGYKGLGYYYLNNKECKRAIDNFKQALYFQPMDKTMHVALFVTYENCLKDKENSKVTAANYYSIFNEPISKEIERARKSMD